MLSLLHNVAIPTLQCCYPYFTMLLSLFSNLSQSKCLCLSVCTFVLYNVSFPTQESFFPYCLIFPCSTIFPYSTIFLSQLSNLSLLYNISFPTLQSFFSNSIISLHLNVYILCLSVRTFVSERLIRSGPKFVWDLTWPQRRFLSWKLKNGISLIPIA